jgi:hypothetical protein
MKVNNRLISSQSLGGKYYRAEKPPLPDPKKQTQLVAAKPMLQVRRGGANSLRPYWFSNSFSNTTETKNIVEKHPEVVERLINLHNQWLNSIQQE